MSGEGMSVEAKVQEQKRDQSREHKGIVLRFAPDDDFVSSIRCSNKIECSDCCCFTPRNPMRRIIFAILMTSTFALAQVAPNAGKNAETMPKSVATKSGTNKSAAKLTPKLVHASALVIDTHADTTQRLLDEDF